MVTFTDEQRRVGPTERPYLLSFRGTRSPKSDAMRNHLPALHNGKDILLLLACRWFDPDAKKNTAYDKDCAAQEKEFEKHTYTELALNSKFSLIVEGFG